MRAWILAVAAAVICTSVEARAQSLGEYADNQWRENVLAPLCDIHKNHQLIADLETAAAQNPNCTRGKKLELTDDEKDFVDGDTGDRFVYDDKICGDGQFRWLSFSPLPDGVTKAPIKPDIVDPNQIFAKICSARIERARLRRHRTSPSTGGEETAPQTDATAPATPKPCNRLLGLLKVFGVGSCADSQEQTQKPPAPPDCTKICPVYIDCLHNATSACSGVMATAQTQCGGCSNY